ncbi:MAG: exopolysaccharide biosynthesis protein [Cyanobacteria bacterium J06588_4]
MSLKFSQEIELLLAKLAAKPITIAEIFQSTGDRGISLIISLLVLPFLFPMPPGLSGVMGIACFCLAIQMALGRKKPWLPKRIARFKFSRSLSQKLLKNIRRITIWLEKITRPRWHRIANHGYVKRTNAVCIAWLSILLMSPIPFTNPPPAITILLLSVANLEADGLLMWIGYFLTLINTILFLFIGYALWQAPQLLPKFFS